MEDDTVARPRTAVSFVASVDGAAPTFRAISAPPQACRSRADHVGARSDLS